MDHITVWRSSIHSTSFFSRQSIDLVLHLGSGDNYIAGMINIEGNIFRKKDLWYDLRNRLPFPKNFVEFVYSSHTLEHLYPDEAIKLLKEIYRILQPNGIARIAVPSFDVMKQFATEAGFIKISRLADETATTLKAYGAITVGQEPAGSLVVELTKM